jgi:hypothetical protein
MTKIIIYPQENNSIAVTYPTGEIPIEEVARKDTPPNTPYLIIDDSKLPKEYDEFFGAWEADFSNPDGYGIGADAWFVEQKAKQEGF